MREKNKALHIAILIIGAVLHLVLLLLIGNLAPEQIRPYSGVLLQIQIIISTLIITTNQKRGFITVMILWAVNLLSCLIATIQGASASMGILVAVISAVILFIIFTFLNKSESQSAELAQQYEQIMDSNRAMQETDKALWKLAYTDSLTGLNNMRYLHEQTEKAIQEEQPFTLIYLDIDNFKHVNDTFGPKTGDVAIEIYAERLSGFCKNQYLCTRSGDDFGILIKGEQKPAFVMNTIEQIQELLSKQVSVQGAQFSVTASYGIATSPRDGKDAETLFDNAVIAVYHAKAEGKDRAHFFSRN